MRGWLVALASSCVTAGAFAQCAGRVVAGPVPELAGVDGSVRAAVEWEGVDAAGSLLVVGGEFEAAGGVMAHGIAAWDGAQWRAIGSGLSGVRELAVLNGSLHALAGASSSSLYRWDGVAWRLVVSGVSAGMTMYDNGLVYRAGGFFFSYDGVSSRRLGALRTFGVQYLAAANGELFSAEQNGAVWRWDGVEWSGVPMPLHASIDCAAGRAEGLLLGGTFNDPAWGVRTTIVWDGAGWNPMPSSPLRPLSFAQIDDELFCVSGSSTVWWNGDEWAAPAFVAPVNLKGITQYRGMMIGFGDVPTGPLTPTMSTVAGYEAGAWRTLGPGLSWDWSGFAVRRVASTGADLYIGGSFRQDYPFALEGVARRAGDHWEPLGSGLGPHASVYSLAADAGSLIVAGDFSSAGGALTENIARWDGAAWRAFGPGLGGPDTSVRAVTRWNGRICAGGSFATSGGRPVRCVAEWHGAEWREVGGGLNGMVTALTEFEGELIASGNFSGTNGGVALGNVAAWDGSAWRSMSNGLSGPAGNLLVLNGVLYASGWFAASNGTSVGGVVRWDGVAWRPVGDFSEGFSGDAIPPSIGVFEGRLTACGGACTGWLSCPRRLRQWDGAAWTTLTGVGPPVLDMTEHNGRLELAGSFSWVTGRAANGTAVYEVGPPVVIAEQPSVVQPENVGDTVEVRAAVRASEAFSYQWRRNGELLGSAVAVGAGLEHVVHPVTLRITSFQPRNVGTYELAVTDECGSVASDGLLVAIGGRCGPVDIGRQGGVEGPDLRLDNNDFVVFVDWFFRGDARADIGPADGVPLPDGVLDNEDFVEFVREFFAGCQ